MKKYVAPFRLCLAAAILPGLWLGAASPSRSETGSSWTSAAEAKGGTPQTMAPQTMAPKDRSIHEVAGVMWVFFRDKGGAEDLGIADVREKARQGLSPRALARRAKVRGDAVVDALDLPVDGRYVQAVEALSGKVRVRSRWLNAVSVEGEIASFDAIRALPFVAGIRPVAASTRPDPHFLELGRVERAVVEDTRALNYGHSTSQIVPIQVNQLHDAGFTGQGILVGVLDTGFIRNHVALDQVNVTAEYDFINDDPITSNEAGDDPGQHNHGTAVLSLLAGYDPGNLIGPAYEASFLLAKTEDITSETPVEEDYWIAAAEWAEGLGADVLSSSLSYQDWYTYSDMDGETAPITIAADLAVANGVSVFISAGNSGDDPWFYIAAPADGDEVMSIGATDSTEVIAPFSSHGPTSDGRRKPDVCAMGRGNFFAIPGSISDYGRGSGTSFSCPIAAGVAALLLEANPLWGPMQVRDALRSTATKAATPDNTYGWGVIRGWNALQAATGAPEIAGPGAAGGAVDDAGAIYVSPNPASATSTLQLQLRAGAALERLEIVDVRGRRVKSWENGGGVGGAERNATFSWDGRDETGLAVPSGIYWARASLRDGSTLATRVVRIRA